MRELRICQMGVDLTCGTLLPLDEDATGHLVRVLRCTEGTPFVVFDGAGVACQAVLKLQGKKAYAALGTRVELARESPLHIELGQVVSRGEKMEFTIQKAVELGVAVIAPLSSERCGVQLDKERAQRKVRQWQAIARAASEQCGRAVVPQINELTTLKSWLARDLDKLSLLLSPAQGQRINTLGNDVCTAGALRMLVGPEGGLSSDEEQQALELGFKALSLGPRVLRTETAALCALSALQAMYGDI